MKNDFMACEMDLEEGIRFAQEEMNVYVGEGGLYFMWNRKWTNDKCRKVLWSGKENRKKSISYLEVVSFRICSGEKKHISYFDKEKLI